MRKHIVIAMTLTKQLARLRQTYSFEIQFANRGEPEITLLWHSLNFS